MYDKDSVKFTWGGVSLDGYATDNLIEANKAPNFTITACTKYAINHPDYSEDKVWVETDEFSFKLYKDSEAYKHLLTLDPYVDKITLCTNKGAF